MRRNCACCGKPLRKYAQRCGPYVHNDDGEMIPTRSMIVVDCINRNCDLYMVTAAESSYDQTISRYMKNPAPPKQDV